MRFLADESCDFSVVRALRALGHDVLAVVESSPSIADEVVLSLAVRESRILLTEDKDFGQLIYADVQPSAGVILIRFPAESRNVLAQAVLDVISREGEQLLGSFVVVQPGRVRISRNPADR